MKVLSRVMIGLIEGAGVCARAVAAVSSPPAEYSNSRRLNALVMRSILSTKYLL
jgi:hypothetical protein